MKELKTLKEMETLGGKDDWMINEEYINKQQLRQEAIKRARVFNQKIEKLQNIEISNEIEKRMTPEAYSVLIDIEDFKKHIGEEIIYNRDKEIEQFKAKIEEIKEFFNITNKELDNLEW